MPRPALLCLTLCLFSSSLLVAETTPRTIVIGKKPESVCRGFGSKLYVTLINGDEPGDGTIVALDGDTVTTFATGFNNPKGLVFVAQQLIAADETTLWTIDKTGKATKLVEAKDFPQPIEFLNDVAVGKDGESVYVSEMSNPAPMFDPSGVRQLWATDSEQAKTLPNKGCVYKVTLKGEISVAVPAGNAALKFPNGVAVGGNKEMERVFVGDFFSGDITNYRDGKYHIIASGMRGIDGITVGKDFIFASSWTQGKVWKVNRQTKENKVIHEGLQTAADFFYDAKNMQLVIPDMEAGTLTFLPIE